MKHTIQKIMALLLAILMLATLCACNSNSASQEAEDPATEATTTEKPEEQEKHYTEIPDTDAMITCYIEYYDTTKEPQTVVRVIYDTLDGNRIGTADRIRPDNGGSPLDFLTNSIIEEHGRYPDSIYRYTRCAIHIDRPIEGLENNFDLLTEVCFLTKYELEEDEILEVITTKNGYTGYRIEGYASGSYDCFLLDVGLENYYVYIEQCVTDSCDGNEFENLKFEIIKDESVAKP